MVRPDPDAVRAAMADLTATAKPDSSADIVNRELAFLQDDWVGILIKSAKQQHAVDQVKAIILDQADIPQDAKDLLTQATATADIAAPVEVVP